MKKSQVILVTTILSTLSVFLWVAFHTLDRQPSEVHRLVEERAPIAQSNKSVSNITERQGLTIQLTTNRSFYTLGEPLSVTIAVRNQTNAPILIHDAFSLEMGAIRVQIAGDNGTFLYYRGPFPTASTEVTPEPLNPGEQRSLSFDILYNDPSGKENLPYIYAFAAAGRYQLRAVLENIIPNETLFSDPITLELLAPQGIDAQIWRLLQTEDAANFLQTSSARNPNIVLATFAAILAQHPKTLYAPYFRTALAPYQATQPQNGDGAQAAQQAAPVTLLTVDNQLYLARSTADGNASGASAANADVLASLVALTEQWVAAWNERDLDQYAQSYSYGNDFRQKWETGPGNFNYESEHQYLETLFADNAKLSVEIIGFTINANEITADVIGRLERDSKMYSFDTMRFVLDDDGVWRLYSPAF